MTDIQLDTPSLVVSRRARIALRYAVEAKPGLEVGGFASITRKQREGGLQLWVDEIIIPPQEVNPTTSHLKPEVLSAFMEKLASEGKVLADYPVWWHSHARSSVHPSKTDLDTLEDLAVDLGTAFGLITNFAGDYHAWFSTTFMHDFLGEIPAALTMDVLHEKDVDKRIEQSIMAMMKEVKEERRSVALSGLGYSYSRNRHMHDGHVCWCINPPKQEDDPIEEAYFSMLQSQFPPGHPATKMTLEEFMRRHKEFEDAEEILYINGMTTSEFMMGV